MFFEIVRFELKYALKKPSTYVFFSIYFAFYLFVSLASSGIFDLGSADSNTFINSALANASLYLVFNQNILALIHNMMLIAIMATAIQRDFEYNSHALFFTKPITKPAYFFGRFIGVYTIALLVFSGQFFGLITGNLIAQHQPVMGPFHLYNFLQPFLYFVLPNTFLFGVVYFSLTTFFRNTTIAYLFTIVFFLFDLTSGVLMSDVDHQSIAALLDPYGNKALQKITQYWTPFEQNNQLLPLSDWLLYNRLIWLSAGLLIMWISYIGFSFSQFLRPFQLFSFGKNKRENLVSTSIVQDLSSLPKVKINNSGKYFWNQLFFIAGFEFKRIIKSYFFITMIVLGIVFSLILNHFNTLLFGTEVYPVTYKIIEQTGSMFVFMLTILVVFHSGNLISSERQYKVDELIGTTPIASSSFVVGKYMGLLASLLLGLLFAMITGMTLQMLQGFYAFELSQYFVSFFGRFFISLSLTAALCFMIQLMVSNKYVGFVLTFIITFLTPVVLSELNLDNPLYEFNSSGPMMAYSDMNGFAHTLPIYYMFKLYWMSVVVLLFAFTIKFYLRGKEKGLKARWKFSRYDSKYHLKRVALIALIVFCTTGAVIYYNVKVANEILTQKEEEKLRSDYEHTYKYLQKIQQPRITASYVEVDLFPHQLGARFKGYYFVKNKHAKAIDTLVVNYNYESELTMMELSVPSNKIIDDKKTGVIVYKLLQPLQAGDSVKLAYALSYFPKSWFSNDPKTDVVYNGTFINNNYLPSIGYNDGWELSENEARKKYKLPIKERMASLYDTAAYANTYIAKDADWINFECIVSTEPDQIAVAPGYLIKEYVKNDRRYFHYKMDAPILNFYSFLSAKYQVKKDRYKGVNIEIFYHKGHEYNLDRMIKSIKKSMAYYESNFGPYQHRQIRILEFPRYASFAQSFPNTIPYSESIGFIAHVNEKDSMSVDYPFYVTAHELAHQWWAHQVIGADVQGSTLMSETMAEYSALMVMEKEYGTKVVRKFLKDALNGYLMGRAVENKKELPIMLAENQQYIHYKKGCLIMYALKDYIGEDSLNAALRRYVKKVAFQSAPYTTSKEFVENLKLSTPDSLQYVIKDLFEDITIYENYVKEVKSVKQPNGKYKVILTVGSVKYKADTLGKRKAVPVNDWMDIGVFSSKEVKGKKIEKELLLKRVKMDAPIKTFEFEVNELPDEAGLDPYNILIDRAPENNRCKIGVKPVMPDLK